MAKIILFLDKRRECVNSTYPLKFRISLPYNKRVVIGTGVYLREAQWNGTTIVSGRDRYIMMDYLDNIKRKVTTNLAEMTYRTVSCLSTKELKEVLLSDSSDNNKFCVVARDFIARKTNTATRSSYQQMYDKFLSSDERFENRTIEDINYKWLIAQESALLEQGLSVNTIAIYMRYIRSIYNEAIKLDLVDPRLYPFKKYTIAKTATRKRALNHNELKAIINYAGDEQRYADIFMLSFYLVGINTVDLLLAKPSQLKDGRLSYTRAKTGKQYDVLVVPEAMEIISKYRGDKYLINVMDRYGKYRDFTVRLNKRLKIIGKEIGVPELSSYYARHTWATIAFAIGVPKDDIALALGHGTTQVTDIYINVDTTRIDMAIRKVMAKIAEL